ncbi:MAG: hypothetical protein QXE32_01075 [Sulfolobales archaeon]
MERGWKLRCRNCGTEWILRVSYKIDDYRTLYHYCRVCGKNTFHDIIGRIEEVESTTHPDNTQTSPQSPQQ